MSDPRWLDDEQQQAWRAFLATVTLLDAALDRQLQRDSGMTHNSYLILAMLSEAPDRTRQMSELAVVTNSSQSRLSHAINRLEQLGWVRRARSAQDKRLVLATLTEAGMQTLRTAAPGHVGAVRRHLFDQLSADQVRQLQEICQTVLGALGAAESCGLSSPLTRSGNPSRAR